MKTLFTLLKTNFINTYGINKILKSKKSKMILYGLLIVLFGCYLLGLSGFYAWVVADSLQKFNLISFMLTIFFLFATFATFMFTIYSAKSGLFNANDNDMLLSMPIKSSTILASRLLNLTLNNLIASLFVMGPALVIYAIKVNVPVSYYLFAILVFILLPVIPTVLACLIGYFIAYLTSKSNSKNWLEIILSLILVLAIMFVSSYGNKLLTFIVHDMKTIETILKWGFYPVYLVNEMFASYNYVSLLIFVLINLILLFIFIVVLSKSFKRIIAKLQENRTKSNYVMKTLKTESASKSLFIKDLKRYFSSPIYVFNTSFGVVFILIMAIVSIFYDKSKIFAMMDINQANVTPFMIAVLIVAFVVFMSNTAAASISIEGKNFWIMKSLPIEPKKILNSKLLLNMFLVLPIVFISIIIIKFTFALSLVEMLLLFLIAALSSLVAFQFGLLVNLRFPKMDAVSDMVVVKQSMSVLISILVPMVLIFATAGIYGELGINFNLFLYIVIILFIILIIIERVLLNTWGIKLFNKIS